MDHLYYLHLSSGKQSNNFILFFCNGPKIWERNVKFMGSNTETTS